MNPVARSRLLTAAAYLSSVASSIGIMFSAWAFGIAWIAIMIVVFAVAAIVRFGVWLHTWSERRGGGA